MKAIGLLSGGLDSMLAVKLVLHQDIEVVGYHFASAFCTCHPNGCEKTSRRLSERLQIPVHLVRLDEEFLEMIRHQKFGFGHKMNPCIDCRIMTYRKAKTLMKETGASFIVTGEVLNQRPMSQFGHTLSQIEKESALEGLIVRPLSAQRLAPSIPEKMGWVDRSRFKDICGRRRTSQKILAQSLGLLDELKVTGGCRLTDSGFASRMKDLMTQEKWDLHDIQLLRIGRHFRISPERKLILGRNEKENRRLKTFLTEGDTYLTPVSCPGPEGLIRGSVSDDRIAWCAGVIAKYAGSKTDMILKITRDHRKELLTVKALPEINFKPYHIR
ncbi:MAG: hypothetical protein JW893_05475 [Candidatus Omnitrophica bacterium]|nr:hypothetical protein [Candidatus Omnitrophota bacterium]